MYIDLFWGKTYKQIRYVATGWLNFNSNHKESLTFSLFLNGHFKINLDIMVLDLIFIMQCMNRGFGSNKKKIQIKSWNANIEMLTLKCKSWNENF